MRINILYQSPFIHNFFVEKNSNNISEGTVIAYKVSDKFQVLGEYYMQKEFDQ